jgi:hypothetical protein
VIETIGHKETEPLEPLVTVDQPIIQAEAVVVAAKAIATAMGRVTVDVNAVKCEMHAFLPPRPENFPTELVKLSRWVVWKGEGPVGSKPVKVPYDPTLIGNHAKVNESNTWGTFAQADAAYSEGGLTGFGIVLNGDGLAGIDIDNCVVDGEIAPNAIALMDQLGVGYVELSPSGTGLRGFGYAQALIKGTSGMIDGLKVELYSDVRYLTVTGHAIKNEPFAELRGFNELAEQIRNQRKVNQETGEYMESSSSDRQAELVRLVISGEQYHDCLRDLAASHIANNMPPGAVVNMLRALMNCSTGPRDSRWQNRFDSIPELVNSASEKFKPMGVDISRIMANITGMSAEGAEAATANHLRYQIRSATDLANAPPLEWTVRGLVPKTGLAALYGPSGSGKSFLVLDLGATIAGGATDWYGKRVTHCPVTYCVLEGEAGMGKRVKAWQLHHDKALPESLRFVTQPVNLRDEKDVTDLAFAILAAGGKGGVVILDTLNRAAPEADENSSKDMGSIITAAKALQRATEGLVLIVHHTGKEEGKGMRGHSSLYAALDSAIGVSKTKDGPAWTVSKSKDDAMGAIYPFRLEVVETGTDDMGEEITSCIAVSAAPPMALRETKKLGKHQQPALTAIFTFFKARGVETMEIEMALSLVENVIVSDEKHKRQRAKEAIEALHVKGLIVIDATHIKKPE